MILASKSDAFSTSLIRLQFHGKKKLSFTHKVVGFNLSLFFALCRKALELGLLWRGQTRALKNHKTGNYV